MRIEPTSERCLDYLWFGQHCLDLQSTGNKALSDGRTIVICKYTPEKATLIVIEGGNFFIHPRSGKVQTLVDLGDTFLQGVNHGGYQQNADGSFTPLARQYNQAEGKDISYSAYPLIDDDHGTFIVNVEDVEADWTEDENYGNCWWIGEDGVALSWKGTPNRLIPIPTNYLIPGITTATGFNVSTCFSGNIYSNGAVLCTAPRIGDNSDVFVAGACYIDGYLICISHQHSDQGDWIYVHKSSDSGTTWELIGDQKAGQQLITPAFISADGKTFSLNNVLFNISDDLKTLSVVSTVVGSSTGSKQLIEGQGYRYSGSITGLWPGMSTASALVSSSATLTASLLSSGDTNATTNSFNIPIVRPNAAKQVSIIETGLNAAGACTGAAYTLGFTTDGGSYCSAEWSGDVTMRGGIPVLCVDGCSATGTVTLQPNGVSASYTKIRLATNILSSSKAKTKLGLDCDCSGAGVVYSPQTSGGRQRYYYVMKDSAAYPSVSDIKPTLERTNNGTISGDGVGECLDGSFDLFTETYIGWNPVGTNFMVNGTVVVYSGPSQTASGNCFTCCSGGVCFNRSFSDTQPAETDATIIIRRGGLSQQTGNVLDYCTGSATMHLGFTLASDSECKYLGGLSSGDWRDGNNNPVNLPSLTATQSLYICQIDTLGC